ncbi:uncharacterized protein N7529_009503 [Penicillium soppii]|uniref:uncharacterized protein n=1 Tax=Penicillium soppii TaxID=69789 RepID=UPI00254739B9|nr:uncharacterized protein N7529_009503 [Penicillium soppii]KAJ5855559.1 hypothetical protein N7529_009503 [Penicillium soppii]
MLQLREWNSTVPKRVDRCLHELIAEQSQSQPDAPAVCAWDGNFTYSKLEELSSVLAAQLADRGVGPEVFVPICFEKSRWTSVALLAVLKAGGAFVLLDSSEPLSRLQEICATVNAILVLSSPQNESRSKRLADSVIVLSSAAEISSCCKSHDNYATAFAQPHHAAYASFTSGWTGNPKAVVVEHSAYCSNALAHMGPLQLHKGSRVLQSASYALGVSILQMVTTWMAGGCVCVPAESACSGDFTAAASNLAANWVLGTPSMLKELRPKDMPHLRHVVLVGETPVRDDITAWPDRVQVIKGYNNAECSMCCSVAQNIGSHSNPQLVGNMTGSVGWIVEPLNHHKLTPLGMVGELLVEGPSLARGYLHDIGKTAKAFIDPPRWFSEFCERYNKTPERGYRMYKTGDLVRYDADGNLLFVMRKESPAKVRGQQVKLDEVVHHQRESLAGDTSPPAPAMERHLRGLWAGVLGLPPNKRDADQSFLQLGGDSIAAVQLVAAAREEGLALTVADVLNAPHLSQMAHVAKAEWCVEDTPAPFSLLQPGITESFARAQAAAQCRIATDLVEDVFPCTPLQEGMLAMTAKRSGDYVCQIMFELGIGVELERLERSWREVVVTTPILRTRIANLAGQGLVQVVVAGQCSFTACQDLEEYLQVGKQEPIGLGAHLTRFYTISSCSGQRRMLVWMVHHALFDRWSMPLVLKQVQQAYHGLIRDRLVPFQGFVKHILQSSDGSCEYWQSQLSGSEAEQFPSLPSPGYQPQPDDGLDHQISGLQWPQGKFTVSTMVRAAWAIVQGHYTNSPDVIFGATVTGRQVPVLGVERIAAPTIATVPVRVRWTWETDIQDLLQQVQIQAISMTAYEQMGLQYIRQISPDTELGCRFQTLVVVQPLPREILKGPIETDDILLEVLTKVKEDDGGSAGLNRMNSYAMMIECQISTNGLNVRIGFDSHLVEKMQVQCMVCQLEHVLRKICAERNGPLAIRDVCGVSPEDWRQLQEWNGTVPARVDRCVHEMVEEWCRAQPDAPAVCAWDGEFTYGELDMLSSALAAHLAEHGVGPEVFVPLCFEKSRWTTVAMMGVMKAGGAFVLLDPSHPPARLRGICQTVSAALVLSSAANRAMAAELAAVVVVAGGGETVWRSPTQAWLGSAVTPDNALYAVFTSGSTGTPKGVVIQHYAYSSAATSRAAILHIDSSTRGYQFASYAFDVSISDHLGMLSFGGCVCVPSDVDRLTNISASLKTLNANFAGLTPKIAKQLQPEDLASLRTLSLGGEKLDAWDKTLWPQHLQMFNGYGPAECSVNSTYHKFTKKGDDLSNIGHGVAAVCWVVNRVDHERLMPIGAVGELLIEGPIVGRGYLNDPEQTAAAFVAPPAWLRQFRDSGGGWLYKTGDLVKYAADGSLHFMGRKDTQVKLRGQRIELGEVEHHTRQCFPGARDVVAEVVTPAEAGRAPMLMAFVSVDNPNQNDRYDDNEKDESNEDNKVNNIFAAPTDGFRAAIPVAEAKLHDAVPAYMVPAIFLPLVVVPLGATGKTDRRRLREHAASLTRPEIQAYCSLSTAKCPPTTAAEQKLQQLWAQVLKIEPDSIGADDSFFRLGGDSISAMQLASLARSQGLELSVSDIFALRQLSMLAKVLVKSLNVKASTNVEPFSFLDPEHKSALLYSRPGSPYFTKDTILDILPVTDLQIFFLTRMSLTHFSFSIQGVVDVDRLRLSCHSLIQAHSIMRTVFIRHQDKFLQVVLKSLDVPFYHTHTKESLEPFWRSTCTVDSNEEAISDKPLVKFTLISRSETEHILTVRLSHAQYDGSSKPALLRDLVAAYNQDIQSVPVCAMFSDYVYYCGNNRSESAFRFWRDCLQGSVVTRLPCSDQQGHHVSTEIDESAFGDLPSTSEDTTIPTLINAAFSFVLADLTKEDDVVFGVATTTRAIPLPQVQTIFGPCINCNPLRARFAQTCTVRDLCRLLGDQYAQSLQFCYLDFSDIRDKSTDWPSDTKLGCILNHLAVGDNKPLLLKDGGSITNSLTISRAMLQDQLMIQSFSGNGKLRVQVRTSSRIMDSEKAGLLAKRLMDTANAFARSPEAPLSSMSYLHA